MLIKDDDYLGKVVWWWQLMEQDRERIGTMSKMIWRVWACLSLGADRLANVGFQLYLKMAIKTGTGRARVNVSVPHLILFLVTWHKFWLITFIDFCSGMIERFYKWRPSVCQKHHHKNIVKQPLQNFTAVLVCQAC